MPQDKQVNKGLSNKGLSKRNQLPISNLDQFSQKKPTDRASPLLPKKGKQDEFRSKGNLRGSCSAAFKV